MDVNCMRAGRSVIVERYAALAAASGVKPEEAMHERYLAKQLLRAGSRRQAASVFMALAFRHGRWQELLRAAAALVAPRLTDQLGRARATAAVPATWHIEANAWLRPFRDTRQTELRGPHAWTEAGDL
jgi:hypothetical protein